MTALPPILGAATCADLQTASEVVARDPARALDLTWPAFERAVFRLAGVALSAWSAAGRPDADALPIRSADGTLPSALSLGHAERLIEFCGGHAPILPTDRLTLPAVSRLRAVKMHVLAQIADVPAERLRSARFPLRQHVDESAKPSRKGIVPTTAIDLFRRLRNLEAHHAGGAQEWVDGHPDYAAAFGPLVVAAALDLLGHEEIAKRVEGWRIARLVDVSRPSPGKPARATFEPDDAQLQRAYSEDPVGTLQVGEEAIIKITRDPTRSQIVMPFLDIAHGVPEALLESG